MSAVLASKKIKSDQKDGKRRRLLDAALGLFERRGFDGVAVPEIARAAGVATGTIYLYFRDKADLVNALYRHWKAQYNALVLTPPPVGAEPRQAFSHHWQRMMLFARTYPHAVRFMDLHHHGAYLDAQSRALSRDYLHAAQAFVRDARRAGAIRDLDAVLVCALMLGRGDRTGEVRRVRRARPRRPFRHRDGGRALARHRRFPQPRRPSWHASVKAKDKPRSSPARAPASVSTSPNALPATATT